MTVALLVLAGLCDRVRGGWPEGRPRWVGHVVRYVAGACMAALVTRDWRLVLAGAVAVGLLSWRTDNGWRGDWARGRGDFTNPLLWGLLWALPLALLAWFEPRLLVYLVAAPVGAWLAMLVSVRLPPVRVFDLRHAWPWSELIELPIIGLLAWSLADVF